jgi:hypothetical protein
VWAPCSRSSPGPLPAPARGSALDRNDTGHITDRPVHQDLGQMNGRLEPMHVHGPTGAREDEPTDAIVDAIRRVSALHDRATSGLDPRVYDLVPHNFPADKPRGVHDEDGVVVTAFPVPRAMYRAVGHRIDHAGLSLVCAGDCEPSTLTVECRTAPW